MRCYAIGQKIKETHKEEQRPDWSVKLRIFILSSEEAKEWSWGNLSAVKAYVFSQNIRFCKAEELDCHVVGSFYIPSHTSGKPHVDFSYVINQDYVIFIDDSGFAAEKVDEAAETMVWESPGTGVFFADFLDRLIAQDPEFLAQMELQMDKLEDKVLEYSNRDDFNYIISGYRKKIMKFSHYYLQLSDLCNVLAGTENRYFTREEQRMFGLVAERAGRFREESQMLREYSIQIREEYQFKVDMRQNEIMKVLTVVTTIFLPLSLIAAWYGMNFSYMPELKWRYGYPFVIMASLVILAVCIWLFKKKKFW